jgi:hypothetical protein
MIFKLDKMEKRVIRREMTSDMWFVYLGGLIYFLKHLFIIIVQSLTYKSTLNTVFGSLYLMKKGRDPENDLDPNDPSSKNWKGAQDLIADDVAKPNKSQ